MRPRSKTLRNPLGSWPGKPALRGTCLLLSGVVLAWGGEAQAYNFDAQGILTFDPKAVFVEGFEDFTDGNGITVVQGDALEGNSYVRVETTSQYEAPTLVTLPAITKQVALRFRTFLRSKSSWFPYVTVYYFQGGGPAFTFASLYPTGRMTSDGWVEIESTPVSIDGTRNPYVALSLSAEEVEVDAVEVVEEAGAYKATAVCSGASSGTCSQGQFCVQGYCQDGPAMVPPLPPVAQINLVVDVLERKLKLAFGGIYTRQHGLPEALAEMETMRKAKDAWTFWSSHAKAISLLHDSHTSPYGMPSFFSRGGKVLPVCFVEGSGDLSQAQAPSDPTYADVLVSHVGPDKNLGLKPGDRIVSVDGLHPIAWAESMLGLTAGSYAATDPTVHSGAVEDLATSIASYASSFQIVRCAPPPGTCSAVETVLVSDLPGDSEQVTAPVCDHRPAYHLASGNPDATTHDFEDVRYGLLADSAPGEDFYGMLWNDTVWEDGTPNPWKAAYTTFRNNAKGLVLDHRRGDGGTPNGAAYLTELSLSLKQAAAWSTIGMLGLFDKPLTQAEGKALFDLWSQDEGRVYTVGSSAPKEDIRIAVLLARDVSGSDFFPFGVKGAANTRLFGRRTMGAFSTFLIYEMPMYYFFSLASGDFFDPTGQAQIGRGVEPDENLVPLQSDLLQGKDTVYERALAWVRCGKAVCP